MLPSRIEPDLSRPFVELSLHVEDRHGVVTLADTGVSTGSAVETFVFEVPLSPWEVEAVSSRHVVKQSGAAGRPDAPRDLGGRLFDAVFSGACGRLYAEAIQMAETQGRGLCLRVGAVDTVTSSLPWELLFDRSLLADFVARIPGQSVLRWTSGIPRRGEVGKAADALVIASTRSGPGPLGGALDHWRGFGERRGIRVDVHEEPALGVRGLVGVVEKVGSAVLHLLVDSAPSTRSGSPGIRVGEQRISGDALVRATAEGDTIPPLVVLEGAHTDQLAVELGRVVPVTVGFRGTPSPAAVTLFLGAFYESLADGYAVAAASTRGRAEVAYTYPGTSEWASAVVVACHSEPVLPRGESPDTTSTVEMELHHDPGGDAGGALQRAEVAIAAANLADLRRLWGAVDPALRPRTVQRQLERLTGRLAQDAARSQEGT